MAAVPSNVHVEVVRGDQSAEYRHIVRAMVLLQQAGVPRVGMVTEPPEE